MTWLLAVGQSALVLPLAEISVEFHWTTGRCILVLSTWRLTRQCCIAWPVVGVTGSVCTAHDGGHVVALNYVNFYHDVSFLVSLGQ